MVVELCGLLADETLSGATESELNLDINLKYKMGLLQEIESAMIGFDESQFRIP